MTTTPIPPLEARIIQIARDHNALGDICEFIEYDPDVGRVPGHWRVRWPVLLVANTLQTEAAPPTPKSPKPKLVSVKLTRFQYCTMAQVMHRRREQAITEDGADRMNLLFKTLMSTEKPAHTFSFTPRQLDIIQVEAELLHDNPGAGLPGLSLRTSMRSLIKRIKAARDAHISTTTKKP
jgi:hypothetical protein